MSSTRTPFPCRPRRALHRPAVVLAALLAASSVASGCYGRRFRTLESDVDSLFARAESLSIEHATTRDELEQVKRELARHEEVLRSTRAGTETSAQELVNRIEQLESRLEDQAERLEMLSGRRQTRALGDSVTLPVPAGGTGSTPSPSGSGSTPGGVRVDPNAAYEQAVVDFTQGRFALALGEFRDFIARYPTSELADNAQYGIGEAFYAQAQYDSAANEFRRVDERYPRGDKVAAALYKLGISYQKLARTEDARTAFRALKSRYPRSAEARLADERLREMGAG